MVKNHIAIATLLYSPDYLPGVLTLGYRLNTILQEAVDFPKVSTCLFVTEAVYNDALTDLSRNILHSLYDDVVHIKHLDGNSEIIANNDYNLQLLKRPELAYALIKARLWEQIQYGQILYLDADTLPLNAGLLDVFTLTDDQTALEIGASPDIGWPDMFNSGVMTIVPHETVAKDLQKFILSETSIDGADQGILNQYFNRNCRDWKREPNNPRQWIVLPFLYNVTTPNVGYQCPPAMRYFKNQIKLIHFIGKSKPWKALTNKTFVSNEYTNWWFSIYNEMCTKYTIGNCFSAVQERPGEEQCPQPEEEYYEQDEIPQQYSSPVKATDDGDKHEPECAQEMEGKPFVEEESRSEEEKPRTPVFIPLDFKEWLTTFIKKEDFGTSEEQHVTPPDATETHHLEQDIQALSLDESTQEEPCIEEDKPAQSHEQAHKTEDTSAGEATQDQPDQTMEEATQDQPDQTMEEATPEATKEPVTHSNFRFDWESSKYLKKVERIFPDDIFEYEVDEAEHVPEPKHVTISDDNLNDCLDEEIADYCLRDYIDIGHDEDNSEEQHKRKLVEPGAIHDKKDVEEQVLEEKQSRFQ
ncbi:glycogenin glucosyltransferase GLG1 KNAG_0C01230 [Huiozyma naganishii CBS 8797]|uniref:glycogenin glucosyltransferase n=1 Tax=Huiozyma naganishii (strain ATCC MYA-139 / BCRC 22969 / CBS 8797 / KCTC 17520 / NBRC 10181 / NCYC 3082 / Yp74L-3) TaxID=1071383 RepID=J7S5M0_HUIN7|nr:hypothetical protein KNAG_0C01230 [Kazachstania naganishii CBS 8797]CCK69236.1 hypothetical protein KNAG_0C01230 [Kazachstania naganishii CBS 8797]